MTNDQNLKIVKAIHWSSAGCVYMCFLFILWDLYVHHLHTAYDSVWFWVEWLFVAICVGCAAARDEIRKEGKK